jgi:hypothetical protein
MYMRILKSILLSTVLCCCIQIHSIAAPVVTLQYQTVAAAPYEQVASVTIPVTAVPGSTEIQLDKHPERKSRLARRNVLVKEVFITTGEVLWVMTEIIVQIIIDNPCLLR